MALNLQAEIVVHANNQIGEGPLWDPVDQCLYWVDITRKRIHHYHPVSGETSCHEVDQYISAIVPTQIRGTFLCAMKDGFYKLDLLTGTKEHIVNPEPNTPNNRFNDGKCDPAGRFFAGTMDMNIKPHAGALYCLDAEHGCKKMLSNITISNGLAWSLDGETMYYIDTASAEIAAYSYDLNSGSLGERRSIAVIPSEEGSPDGMTIDCEGMLWIALWGGGKVIRLNPATGEHMASVTVPASQVASCTFGGENLDELYITTAAAFLSKERLASEPLAGSLFRVKTGVRGVEAHSFAARTSNSAIVQP
ncbi:SMP-30/gluconolactonase/LRE family protein [Paenibacillus aquistagni]|uniref:Regucalcin n=1 Tax=Paenibacillus aquistagni TaxID=1852522 RepID=A0A1X7J3T9_9BACL|nr:SMP-30/gluconolactonase/LRE family protein [Paenibacillus aquistagni]SMG22285.1 Sugar lactone lactonase YvrE [Paenibacillus aquistagni]